jgi:hypothetical protein
MGLVDLIGVRALDELALVMFRWLDESFPDLKYVVVSHFGPGDYLESAYSVRDHLRSLLAPGWRDRVERQWLDTAHVLIRARREAASDYIEQERAIAEERRWRG